MDKGFPDKIKKYKIKWYIGPGNYGPILSDAVTYLAISVENEKNSTLLLFLNKKLEVLTVLKCETEQDAFAACKAHGKDRKIGFMCTRIIYLSIK